MRILRGLIFVFAALVILAGVGIFVLLRTEAGLRTAISMGTSLAASEDFTIEIGEASGALASEFSVTDVRVSDREGVWLTLDRARLRWRPLDLLGGTFSAEMLDVGEVAVARWPLPAASAAEPTQTSSGLPVGIQIDRFEIAGIALAQPVAGAEARVTAQGAARLVDPTEGLRLDIDARRIDDRPGMMTAHLGYVPDTGAIDARIKASEPQGGVVARLLNLPDLPPIELLVDGTGHLASGLVTLTLTAGDAGRLDANARLAGAEGGTRVDLDARGDLGRLAPEAYAPLVEGNSTLAARAVVASDLSGIAIERLHWASAGLGAALAGRIDLAGDENEIAFDVTGGEVERFAALIPSPLRWTAVNIKGRATGALAQPTITAQATGSDLAYESHRAQTLSADLAMEPEGETLALAADIRAGGLALDVPHVGSLIGDQARVILDATRQLDGSFQVDRFDFTGKDVKFGFTGTAAPDAVDGTLSVTSPRVTLTAEVEAASLRSAPTGEFSLDGTADGEPVTGAGRFAMGPDGLRLDGLDVSTRSARLVGDLTATPDAPAGDLRLTIGNLADLGPFLPMEARGALEAHLVLEGRGEAATARIEASGRDVVAAGVAIGTADLKAIVTDPFGARGMDGTLTAKNISAGVPVPSVTLTARGPLSSVTTTLAIEAMGGRANAAGILSATDMSFALDTFDLARDSLRVALAEPSRLRLVDGLVATEGLTLTAAGGRITARGRAGSTLDLDLTIAKLPLSLAKIAAPTLDVAGTLDGTARLTGAPATPSGRYNLSVAGLSAPQSRDFGLGAFAVKADGTLESGRTQFTATATGNRTNLRLTGSAPLGAGNLDLRATGSLDASLMNTKLAATGERLSGTVNLDATVKGTTAAPAVGGTARLAGGSFSSPGLGLNLTAVNATVSGDGRSLTLSAFSAATAGGGRLTGQGRVSVDPAGGFPGNLTITANNAQVADSNIVKAIADGRITMEGPLAREPRIGGTVNVRRMEITLPERLPAGSTAIQVEHRNAPPAVQRQIARRENAEEERSDSAFVAALDIAVEAPNQVFLRGQGIDAELSGSLKIRGTTQVPQVEGGFEMRRGTLSVLGQRLEFTRGIATFPGNMTPNLDLVAQTQAGDVTAMVAVTGNASQPGFTLSSEPTLPQDEVMARLLFNRATGELSAGQAIQLAQALASLTGGGPGALDGIRRGLGLDSLDLTTSEGGTPALAVGRYINENISIGARQGATPDSSRVTVDIDVTKNIRIQGEAGAGESKVGVGVEWEY